MGTFVGSVEGVLKDDVQVVELGGKSAAKFVIPSHRYQGKGKEPLTTWVNVTAFGHSGKFSAEFLKKGDTAFVSGEVSKNGDFVNLDAHAVKRSGRAVQQQQTEQQTNVPGVNYKEEIPNLAPKG